MLETTLYRAVTAAELDDIVSTGKYRWSGGSIEGKYFFELAGDAVGFARKMFRLFPDEGPYTITSTRVSVLVLKSCTKLTIAGEGTAWFMPNNLLPLSPVDVWTYCPLYSTLSVLILKSNRQIELCFQRLGKV